MTAELVSITSPLPGGPASDIVGPENLISYVARVSNPENQMKQGSGLIKFLIKHKHWSPFEMVDATFSIKTSRAIAAQILRHRSFSFQEFSQRYSPVAENTDLEMRKNGAKNRQSSTDIVTDPDVNEKVKQVTDKCFELYDELLEKGVAKETARMVLPLSCETHIYMKGSIRSWIHYLELRCAENTQKEHRVIAEQIRDILKDYLPNIIS